jgi:hypothetical protein
MGFRVACETEGVRGVATAEEVFSDTFGRFMRNWTFIMSLRQVADVALPIAEEALAAIHGDLVERVSVDPEYRKIVVKLDGSESDWDEGLKAFLRTGMTRTAINNARSAIDAASLIFAHSVLDDCAWSYLKVCAIAGPADWEPLIRDKEVAFADVRKPLEEIRWDFINKKLEQLEHKSLLSKVDLLFQICTPPTGFAPINNYAYDRDRLVKIDEARHGIIHKNEMGKPLAEVDENLEFISKTSNFLMGLVNQKYGVKINPLRLFGFQAPPAARA